MWSVPCMGTGFRSSGSPRTSEMSPPSTPERRPVNLAALESSSARVKLRTGVILPDTKKKAVSLPRESFVPVVQAEVGSTVSLLVHRYRILVPVVQIIRESAQSLRRILVATDADIFTIRDTLIRHYGGVKGGPQPPSPAPGAGARAPARGGGT